MITPSVLNDNPQQTVKALEVLSQRSDVSVNIMRDLLKKLGITEATDVLQSCFCCKALDNRGKRPHRCRTHNVLIAFPTIYGCRQRK